jgi:hypothetical protein
VRVSAEGRDVLGGVEVAAVAEAEAGTAGRRILAVAHKPYTGSGSECDQVIFTVAERALEPGEFLGEET